MDAPKVTLNKILVWSLIAKIILAIFLPLSADEAYYWVWGQNIRLSYFDHPPAVAWLWKIGEWLFPFKSAARLPGVILVHASLWLWIKGLKNQLTEKQLTYWLLLVLACPMTGIGSVIVTPDLPVIFFWAAGFYTAQQFILTNSSRWACLLGLSIGLGFSSKYHMVLFVFFMGLWIIASGYWRYFKPQIVALITLCFLIGASPVLLWNIKNNFASFRFQLAHGLAGGKYQPQWTMTYVLSQSLIVYPTFVYLAFKNISQFRKSLVAYLGLGPLIFFFVTSFKGLVEANWPVVSYAGFFALISQFLHNNQIIRRAVTFFTIISVFMVAIAFSSFRHKSIEKLFDAEKYMISYNLSKKYSPVYASSYQMASFWWFFSKSPKYKLKGMGRFDFYDDLQKQYPEDKVFYIVQDYFSEPAKWLYDGATFEKVASEGPFDVMKVTR